MGIKIPLRFLGRLSSPLLNSFPPSLPPTDHHTARHATVRSQSRENHIEERSRTIHWRYNLKTQFKIAAYCHVLVAEGGRETFARLLKGRHLSDTEDFISIEHIAEVPVVLNPPCGFKQGTDRKVLWRLHYETSYDYQRELRKAKNTG